MAHDIDIISQYAGLGTKFETFNHNPDSRG